MHETRPRRPGALSMISPGRLWWLLRRDLKRGWSASFHHYRSLPLIKRWHWRDNAEPPHPIPVHVLTGANDWLLAAWMLASWFHTTEISWSVTIHDDGTLPEHGRGTLRRLFPNSRFISRIEADATMAKTLASFPLCLAYRTSHPLSQKIFDMPQFAENERFLVFDSDVLFFKRPLEVLSWANHGGNDECRFNEDVQEGSLVSSAEAMAELGVQLWPRVNSGLCLLQRDAFDFDFCNTALARTSILQGHVWRVEQTLFALCASKYGPGGLLPKTYEVSLDRQMGSNAISRHYVGAVRDRFYGEGVERLRGVLLTKGK